MSYGAHDALQDTIVDLRDHVDLVTLLEDSSMISEGWPKDKQDSPVVVRVQPITETSSHQREFETIQRTFRMQVSVVATDDWRKDQDAPTYRMAEIMSMVADRLDIATDIENLLPEGTSSSSWEEVTGGRVALIQDWQITRYTRKDS